MQATQAMVSNQPSQPTPTAMSSPTTASDQSSPPNSRTGAGETGGGGPDQQPTISTEAQQEIINQKYQNLPKKQHHNLLIKRRTNKTYFDSGDYQVAKSKQQPMTTVMFDGNVAAGIPATPATVELTRHPPERRQSKLIES